MREAASQPTWLVRVGDVREQLAMLPDASVQCVVTSPPYFGLRDYGHGEQIGVEPTSAAYVDTLVAVFREVRRVMSDDGTLWLNLGDSYNAYNGGAGPGSKLSKTQTEQRPRLATGFGLNDKALKPKDLMMIPARVALALQADGWYLRSDIIWAKPNPMPESVTDRPTKAHEYMFLLSKSERYFYDHEAIQEAGTMKPQNRFTDGKGPKADGYAAHRQPTGMTSCEFRNKRTVWTVATSPYTEAHFATFPPKLIEPCILAGCPSGGLVLDPFAGSGTTIQVAQQLGRQGVGIELNPAYVALAETRTAQTGLEI